MWPNGTKKRPHLVSLERLAPSMVMVMVAGRRGGRIGRAALVQFPFWLLGGQSRKSC